MKFMKSVYAALDQAVSDRRDFLRRSTLAATAKSEFDYYRLYRRQK